MSRVALLIGTIGGIVGIITAAMGGIWVLIYNILLKEIYNYLWYLQVILSIIFPFPAVEPWPRSYSGLWPLPIFPSWPLFGVSSSILAMFFIVTGILIGIGFYGTYKIGGGAMSVVGLIFGIIGSTLGALIIIIGNTTIGSMSASIMFEMSYVSAFSVPTPNFTLIWVGYIVLGFTFIILGAASIKIRYMTEKPSDSRAAGALSILGAIFFMGGLLMEGLMLFFGCGLMLLAFIFWAIVFYSSKEL